MLPISVCRFARRRSCPGVSPQRSDSPWHARLFIGESWHTSPGDHIPAGRLFNCQGSSPPTCMEWEGRFARVFLKVFIFPFTCSDWEPRFWGVFLKDFLPSHLLGPRYLFFSGVLKSFYLSTCSHWETCFGRVFCEKNSLYLFGTGEARN